MSNLSSHGQLTGTIRQGSGGGGGGSTVVINPSGAPVGTMEKISVDGAIYDVRNVPDTSGATNGNVLTKTMSGFGWYPPNKELPVFTSSDNNKVLTIDEETLTWKAIPKELPTITQSDEGKVLSVSNGNAVWLTPSGSSLIYTTEEKVAGTWIDGSTLYTRTWVFDSPVIAIGNGWANTPILVSNTHIYLITDSDAISTAGMKLNYVSATTDLGTQTYVRIYNVRSADSQVKYLTLTYTKVGD